MLEQSHFFGDLFWVILETVLRSDILFFRRWNLFPFVVIKIRAMLFNNDLSTIIEEYPAWIIWQDIPQTILAWIINPLLYPNGLWVGCLSRLYLFTRRNERSSFSRRDKCCNLTDCLSAAHRSIRVVRVRSWSFKFNDLVAGTDSYLHLR